MLKNRFMTAFAFAGLIGFAACAAEEENIEFDEGTTLEEGAPPITPAPVTVDSMTMPSTTDTTGMDTTTTDSITM